MKSVVFVLLVLTGASATGVMTYFGKNPGAMPEVGKRLKLLGAATVIVVASAAGILYLGPGM